MVSRPGRRSGIRARIGAMYQGLMSLPAFDVGLSMGRGRSDDKGRPTPQVKQRITIEDSRTGHHRTMVSGCLANRPYAILLVPARGGAAAAPLSR